MSNEVEEFLNQCAIIDCKNTWNFLSGLKKEEREKIMDTYEKGYGYWDSFWKVPKTDKSAP